MMHFTTIGRVAVAAGLVFLVSPAVVEGQSARDSALYLKAQQMVANGDATGGRRLVDSVAAAAPAGSAAYAEGLFWKATLAANARDSEHAYREIIVDYPLSGRVPDALLRIGQLESARGESAAAQQHFKRLVLEHPRSPLRAEGSYWLARMYFDSNDVQRGCTANADAVSSVRASNVELKNRIDFQQQRCRGVTLVTNAPEPATLPPDSSKDQPAATKSATKAATKAATKPVSKQAPTQAPTTQESEVAKAPATVVASAPPSAPVTVPVTRQPAGAPVPPTPPPPRKPPVLSSAERGPVTRPPTKEEVDRALASAPQARQLKLLPDTEKSRMSSSANATTEPASPAPTPATPAAPAAASKGGSYAVQVAAFADKQPATALVSKLRGRGYNAYIDGTKAPYRVRIGHYPTHAAAAAVLVKLKAKHINGFVAQR